MTKSTVLQNRRGSIRARKQGKKPIGRGVRHELIDPTIIIMPQTDMLTSMKVLEDTIERVENDNAITCTGNGTNRKKVSEKAMNI